MRWAASGRGAECGQGNLLAKPRWRRYYRPAARPGRMNSCEGMSRFLTVRIVLASRLDSPPRLHYPSGMRADAESLNEQITASVALLRRHL